MPKFCPECGTKLEFVNTKFCTECGKRLTETTDTKSETTPIQETTLQSPTTTNQLPPPINAHELGTKLEEVVESIFKADGYSTKRRQRIPGLGGYTNEFDIIAVRGNEKIAIECKNLSTPVKISQMRDFAEKIQDLGPGWRSCFCSEMVNSLKRFRKYLYKGNSGLFWKSIRRYYCLLSESF